MKKTKIHSARILVEVKIEEDLPEYIDFLSEKGILLRRIVEYEWKPTKCKFCSMVGHCEEDCRKKNKVKCVWVPKQTQPVQDHRPGVDSYGFQVVARGGRSHSPTTNMGAMDAPVVSNSYDILQQDNEVGVILETVIEHGIGDPPNPPCQSRAGI